MSPRVPRLPASEWTVKEREAVSALFGIPEPKMQPTGSGAKLDPARTKVLSTIVQHEPLARGWFAFTRVLLYTNELPERLRELIILRVSQRVRSEYEYGQHVLMALECGISQDEIDALSRGNDGFSGLDLAVLEAADELMDTGTLSDASWDLLAQDLNRHQMMEVVFGVGAYVTLGMVLSSFKIDLEDGAPRLPTATHSGPAIGAVPRSNYS